MFKPLTLAAALLLAGNVLAAPVSYKIDPNHTNVIASWDHFGFSRPSANFGQVGSGLNSFVADFDAHLRSKDFFEADKYPDATFASTKVEAAGPNKLRVTGDLTMHGVTKPVVLDVTLNKSAPGRDGQPRIGFDATARLKRSDFGLGLFAPKVSDEVDIRITTEAGVPKPEGDATK